MTQHPRVSILEARCVTIETGFHVVVGAALGCQCIPPVSFFSPGWVQWISLQRERRREGEEERGGRGGGRGGGGERERKHQHTHMSTTCKLLSTVKHVY